MKKYRNYIISILVLLLICVSICFVPINASKFIPLIENKISSEIGVKVHIEKLIFRFGPSLKLKAPVMHVMYEDGQKFGQFDNIKLYIPWSSLFKDDVAIKKIYTDKCILKVNSTDKYLNNVILKLKEKDFPENPDIVFKSYSISYYAKELDKVYKISGQETNLSKNAAFKNYKISTIGKLSINDKDYISYDITVVPNIELRDTNEFYKIQEALEQIVSLDFHSDIIADVKLYEDTNQHILMSGLVNIDNISVLDPEKRNPKSFIYLTFLGNKVGILSNIYASYDKKVYIDGNINHSKKPELDLKVKTDNIYIPDLYKKIKLLIDCSKFKGIELIAGTLNADFTIKGDLNKIKSAGFLKITDASIKSNSVNINKISSDIDFNGNSINISNAVGYVNNAPIMLKGKIDKFVDIQLLMSKVELKNMLPSSYGIKNGIMSLDAKLSGKLSDISHKENIQINNLYAEKNNNKVEFSSLKIDTNKENIAYINNIIVKPEKTEFIKIPTLKLYVESDKIKIPETNIFMPNSKIKAKSEILNYNNNNYNFNFVLDGSINSKDLHVNNLPAGNYPIKLNINGDKAIQNIESQIHIDNAILLDEPSIINFLAKKEADVLKIEDLSIIPFNGKFSNNLKSNIKGSKKIIISGNIENILSPVFKNLRIFIPQQLNLTVNDTIAQIKGDIFVNGRYDKPEVVGQLSIQSLINQFLQLSSNNITVDFNKDIAVINAPFVKIADSVLSFNSTVSTNISQEVIFKNVNIKSKFINTDSILMYKDEVLNKLLPVKVQEGKFYAEKCNVSIYNSPLMLSALSADFKYFDNVFKAKNVASELFNGKITGKFDFNLRDESYETSLMARGVSASPIFDVVAIKKDSVSGVMDFDTSLTGNLSTKQSLNGNIKFIVRNGRMGTLGKLEHLLYAQNVVADNMLRTSLSVVTKAITLKDTGLFKYLCGDIQLKDGVANIKYLQSQGPLMSLYIKGIYYPMTDYAKLTVLGRLSDEVISGLGSFGEFSMNKLMIMLTGEESKNNVKIEDIEKLPQLPMKNTKEFRSIINGIIEKPSSVILFNWISYSKKSYRQKEAPMTDSKVPDFLEALPY